MRFLIVAALESEIMPAFDAMPCLLTGVGKVNAAMHLTRAILDHDPDCIVNVGTAGSAVFDTGSVVCCYKFIQRDMDVRGLGFAPYETPFSGQPPILDYGATCEGFPLTVCGSGDSFDTAKTGQEPWQVVDMEAYALAAVCQNFQKSFICLKYISDGANGSAASDWTKALQNAPTALYDAVQHVLKAEKF